MIFLLPWPKVFTGRNSYVNNYAEAVQIHGGYGFVKEYHVERLMRDKNYPDIRGAPAKYKEL